MARVSPTSGSQQHEDLTKELRCPGNETHLGACGFFALERVEKKLFFLTLECGKMEKWVAGKMRLFSVKREISITSRGYDLSNYRAGKTLVKLGDS